MCPGERLNKKGEIQVYVWAIRAIATRVVKEVSALSPLAANVLLRQVKRIGYGKEDD